MTIPLVAGVAKYGGTILGTATGVLPMGVAAVVVTFEAPRFLFLEFGFFPAEKSLMLNNLDRFLLTFCFLTQAMNKSEQLRWDATA